MIVVADWKDHRIKNQEKQSYNPRMQQKLTKKSKFELEGKKSSLHNHQKKNKNSPQIPKGATSKIPQDESRIQVQESHQNSRQTGDNSGSLESVLWYHDNKRNVELNFSLGCMHNANADAHHGLRFHLMGQFLFYIPTHFGMQF